MADFDLTYECRSDDLSKARVTAPGKSSQTDFWSLIDTGQTLSDSGNYLSVGQTTR